MYKPHKTLRHSPLKTALFPFWSKFRFKGSVSQEVNCSSFHDVIKMLGKKIYHIIGVLPSELLACATVCLLGYIIIVISLSI